MILKANEVIQAGDCFLIKVDCPRCTREFITGTDDSECSFCGLSMSNYVFQLASRKNFTLLAGTYRRASYVRVKTIRTLREIQQNQCAYCFKHLDDYHVDHIVPLSFGGSNSISNLVLACPPCNLAASDCVFTSLEAKRDFLSSRERKQRSLN